MAYEEVLKAISRPAGADLTGKYGFLATLAGGTVAVNTGAAGACDGVIASEPKSGFAARLIIGGVAKVVAGAAVAAGALVESDASGRVITRSAGVTLGRAMTAAGAAGEFISVRLVGMQ